MSLFRRGPQSCHRMRMVPPHVVSALHFIPVLAHLYSEVTKSIEHSALSTCCCCQVSGWEDRCKHGTVQLVRNESAAETSSDWLPACLRAPVNCALGGHYPNDSIYMYFTSLHWCRSQISPETSMSEIPVVVGT